MLSQPGLIAGSVGAAFPNRPQCVAAGLGALAVVEYRAHEDAPRDDNARRPAPRDAVAVAELRALSAPRAVGLRCRRHPLGRAASSDVLRQRARAQCLLELLPHSVSIIWVEPLPYSFVAWKALQRIKCLNSVTLVRRIDILPRCRVEDQSTRVAQPLCFR
jgi:hypothetical protein